MKEFTRHRSNIIDVEFGKDVVVVDPVNLYGCTLDDEVFIGPFVEIQENVKIGNKTKVQSHTFICSLVTIGSECFISHGVMFVNDKFEEIESLLSEGKSFKEAIKSARLSSETLKPYNSQIPLDHPKAAILMEQTYLLNSGQLAPPIQTEEGVLIACVSLRDIANTNELSNQKERIQASLIQQKRANLISSWQADIIAEANIQIFEDKPNS